MSLCPDPTDCKNHFSPLLNEKSIDYIEGFKSGFRKTSSNLRDMLAKIEYNEEGNGSKDNLVDNEDEIYNRAQKIFKFPNKTRTLCLARVLSIHEEYLPKNSDEKLQEAYIYEKFMKDKKSHDTDRKYTAKNVEIKKLRPVYTTKDYTQALIDGGEDAQKMFDDIVEHFNLLFPCAPNSYVPSDREMWDRISKNLEERTKSELKEIEDEKIKRKKDKDEKKEKERLAKIGVRAPNA